MKILLTALIPALLVPASFAQLQLPNPPWLPPNTSTGALPSSGKTPNSQWSSLLGSLLYFYDAQRSGKLPENYRVDWRNDSSLDDGKDAGLDLSGGYHDAGDYIKATLPLSFSLMSLCWGALDFGEGYDAANQTAYLDGVLRWGLDWLMKAHPSSNTLFVLVGSTDLDNAYWGGDQDIPTPRASYPINDTHPGTETAAQASAAFSACSLLYANDTSGSSLSRASLQNSTYAEALLSHATSLHNFALNATGGRQVTQKAVPAIEDAYGASAYEDELALSALFLAWAHNSTDLYQAAEDLYNQFELEKDDGVFNWDGKAPGIPVLFTQMLKTAPAFASVTNRTIEGWQQITEAYFDKILKAAGRGKLTKGGLLWYNGDSDFASLNPALNAAMLMTRYAPLASSTQKGSSYRDYAQIQLDYALGDNPMSAPYVVGMNPNSPQNPHSAPASGGSDIGNIDTSPQQEAYILYGAVVGGPDKNDKFWDIRSDWIQGEVALDYNAPLLTLAAAHVMSDSSDPFYTSLKAGAYESRRPDGKPCNAAISCEDNLRLPKVGQIVIGVVITAVGLVILGLLATWVVVTRRGRGVDGKS